jgi:hypothetical protein
LSTNDAFVKYIFSKNQKTTQKNHLGIISCIKLGRKILDIQA